MRAPGKSCGASPCTMYCDVQREAVPGMPFLIRKGIACDSDRFCEKPVFFEALSEDRLHHMTDDT